MSRLLKSVCLLVAVIAFCPPVLAGNVVTVPCPPGIVDSSQEITDALLSIRPGGTVRLAECTYYLSNPVVVTGRFNGALRGAGTGKTVLTTLADADGIEDVLMLNATTDLDNPGTPGPTLFPTLFHFSLFGDKPNRIAMSDLTIDIADEHPAFDSARAGWFGGALLAIITVEGVNVSTDFDRIRLKAVRSVELPFGTNVCYGIEMWGEMSFWPAYGTKKPMTGSQVLRRSVFEGVWTGYDAENMANSHVMLRDNRFVAPAFSGVLLATMSASSVHVTQNDIELADTGWYGIWMELMEGVLVNQNRIAGSGLGGIYAGSGSRYLILNNNLEDLAVPAGSFPVWLGAATSDSLVIGVDPALVLDEGTNNRIMPGGREH